MSGNSQKVTPRTPAEQHFGLTNIAPEWVLLKYSTFPRRCRFAEASVAITGGSVRSVPLRQSPGLVGLVPGAHLAQIAC
jgi:hypothetical protein